MRNVGGHPVYVLLSWEVRDIGRNATLLTFILYGFVYVTNVY